jgi:hypothetical protein
MKKRGKCGHFNEDKFLSPFVAKVSQTQLYENASLGA